MDRLKDSEEQFEREWREAMDKVNVLPSSAVWDEIDRKLPYPELSANKSRFIYYRWAAAALILMVLFVGVLRYLYFQNIGGKVLSERVIIDKPEPIDGYNWNIGETVNNGPAGMASPSKDNTPGKALDKSDAPPGHVLSKKDEKELWEVANITGSLINADFKTNIVKPEKIPAIGLPDYSPPSKKRQKQEKYFAGVNFGSGGFDPNFKSTSGDLLAANLEINPEAFSLANNEAINRNSPLAKEEMLEGESVSLGLSFGIKLDDRWTLESGLQYVQADVVSQTDVVITTSAWQEPIVATGQISKNKMFSSTVRKEQTIEYEYRGVSLKNQFRFTSVPMTAGYLLIDKKLKLELNAGVAANFYMGNKLTGHENKIAQLSIGPGSESPYRGVSFSGLAGFEIGYRMFKKLDVIIGPNYRQSINSLTKVDATFLSNPSGFGVMTGIKFNFN